MIKRFFLIVAVATVSLLSYGQSSTDTISIVKNKYLLQGQPQKPRQLLNLMQNYPDAYLEMRKAKSNYDAASVFGFIGGFCIGYPLGQALAGGEPTWALAGVGAGMLVISIPLSNAYNKRAKNAIRMYNSEISGAAMEEYKRSWVLKAGITPSGVGLTHVTGPKTLSGFLFLPGLFFPL